MGSASDSSYSEGVGACRVRGMWCPGCKPRAAQHQCQLGRGGEPGSRLGLGSRVWDLDAIPGGLRDRIGTVRTVRVSSGIPIQNPSPTSSMKYPTRLATVIERKTKRTMWRASLNMYVLISLSGSFLVPSHSSNRAGIRARARVGLRGRGTGSGHGPGLQLGLGSGLFVDKAVFVCIHYLYQHALRRCLPPSLQLGGIDLAILVRVRPTKRVRSSHKRTLARPHESRQTQTKTRLRREGLTR